MYNNILFLDHFGVMCLANPHGKISDKNYFPNVKDMRVFGEFEDFNIDCINILNEILDITDADIVISSDWKNWATLTEMKNFYKKQFIKEPIDFTPDLKIPNIYTKRATEVKHWLSSNDVKNWVCVDDLYLELDNFVWITQTDMGLKQDGIKDQIIQKLKS